MINNIVKLCIMLCFVLIIQPYSYAQHSRVQVSGSVNDKVTKAPIPFVNVVLKSAKDSAFVTGTISNEQGRFTLANVAPNSYVLEVSFVGYNTYRQAFFVGSLTEFVEVPSIYLQLVADSLTDVQVSTKANDIKTKFDKKIFSVEDNLSQTGGSALQMMQNLPGISTQDGKVLLRGSDKVIILVDGKQTALTGMGSQSGLDNIPASAIEKIEIINNPSSKYDANGNAGIINIVFKKNKSEGFNGKIGLAGGAGALWVKQQNLPQIRPQYQHTPKINPSLSLNYRKNKLNLFFQGDYLYTETLNKNEFVTRTYDSGLVINQQTKRNRNAHFATIKTGADIYLNKNNTLTCYALYGLEKIIDNGDEPFYNQNISKQLRLWQFVEDELKTTVMASAVYQLKFKQLGHGLQVGFNYTFHREDEKYFFTNIMPTYTGYDSFKLISDEHVADFSVDYVKPLKYGKLEVGAKYRWRDIPTNMHFLPGLNSPLDTTAGGPATYKEIIPAVYSNYVFENKHIEAELGLRVEYVKINYEVGPTHPVYKSDGYDYIQPFPTVRFAYKLNADHKLMLNYTRRVDRPNEVDIRIFPKYDDAEIIKVGNPALRPQFTNNVELGYKSKWTRGYVYIAAYHKFATGTITRVSSVVPNSNLIYAIFQNADKSYQSGFEVVLAKQLSKKVNASLNINGYQNSIDAFTVQNKYPVYNSFVVDKQQVTSGFVKLNVNMRFTKQIEVQAACAYLAPDIIPQGKIGQRFSVDVGAKKLVQKGKGEVFINATDIANTMVLLRTIQGVNFHYTATDYYETQVIRLGYTYKF